MGDIWSFISNNWGYLFAAIIALAFLDTLGNWVKDLVHPERGGQEAQANARRALSAASPAEYLPGEVELLKKEIEQLEITDGQRKDLALLLEKAELKSRKASQTFSSYLKFHQLMKLAALKKITRQ